jgi:hypothetical protein
MLVVRFQNVKRWLAERETGLNELFWVLCAAHVDLQTDGNYAVTEDNERIING